MIGLAGGERSADTEFGRLEPGFGDPMPAAQACFRAILDAMAHPGQIGALSPWLAGLPPEPVGAGAASVALTLCDLDTPVWFDEAAATAAEYVTFHCGAPLARTPDEARFAFIADAATVPLHSFALGTDEYPERSTTVVIEVADLTNGSGVRLRGPGIRGETRLGVAGLPARFWGERAALAELFPRGFDILFVSGDRLAALPRSTRIAL